MSASGCPDTSHVRLRKEFSARFQETGWPGRKVLARFCRSKGYEADLCRPYAAMRRGDAIPRAVGLLLVEFVRDCRTWDDVTPENALEPASSEVKNAGSWLTWHGILDTITDRFGDRDEMYVHQPRKEIPLVAEAIMGFVGRMSAEGEPTDHESCLRRGAAVMNRSLADLTRWLTKLYAREFRTIMFAACPGKGDGATQGYQKASVSVMFPIKEKAFQRFAAGEIADYDLGPDDIECPSKYLFFGALAWPFSPAVVSDAAREAAEVHCIIYQAAYFTRVRMRPWRPVLCTFAGVPMFRERLLGQGYRDTGALMPGTNKPVMVLRHPREAVAAEPSFKPMFNDWKCYSLMQVAFRLYRWANYREWKQEDRYA